MPPLLPATVTGSFLVGDVSVPKALRREMAVRKVSMKITPVVSLTLPDSKQHSDCSTVFGGRTYCRGLHMVQTQFQNREDCVGRGKLMFFPILQPMYRPGPWLAVLGERTFAVRFERMPSSSFMVALCRTNTCPERSVKRTLSLREHSKIRNSVDFPANDSSFVEPQIRSHISVPEADTVVMAVNG